MLREYKARGARLGRGALMSAAGSAASSRAVGMTNANSLGPAASHAATPPDAWYDDELGDPSPSHIANMTRAWQVKRISNLEYLDFVNSVAGRCISDFSQYPVFPWVVADYTSSKLDLTTASTFRDLSKPIGALNPARLEALLTRYREMPRGEGMDPPFLYGTHYSTPGYCLYYLVRAMPEHMLRLQSGNFDAPDRLFSDVAQAWMGVTSTNMDVKELIPEFYKSDGAFLLSPDGLDLGVRQNGQRVGSVALPPWAYDAADFIAQNRRALESDAVSAQLHHWIDLIFGYKQQGPAAEAAHNIFYHMTYEGAVDFDAIAGDAEKVHALQQQIAEFGQTPHQLFHEPHVARGSLPLPAPVGSTTSPHMAAAAAGARSPQMSASYALADAAAPLSPRGPVVAAGDHLLAASPSDSTALGSAASAAHATAPRIHCSLPLETRLGSKHARRVDGEQRVVGRAD
ncbi:hypothetical protein EON62_04445, partial [archaeon]